jgi:hypothetical protein
MSNEPQVTTASQWKSKKRQGMVVTLPSGNSVRMRRTLDIFTLLKTGRVPNPLAAMITEVISTQGDTNPFQNIEEEGGEPLSQLLELVNGQIPRIVIEPKVVLRPDDAPADWEPPEDAIEVEDFDLEDRMFLFGVAQGGPADLASFRREQDAYVASAQDGQDVPAEAERASGDT